MYWVGFKRTMNSWHRSYGPIRNLHEKRRWKSPQPSVSICTFHPPTPTANRIKTQGSRHGRSELSGVVRTGPSRDAPGSRIETWQLQYWFDPCVALMLIRSRGPFRNCLRLGSDRTTNSSTVRLEPRWPAAVTTSRSDALTPQSFPEGRYRWREIQSLRIVNRTKCWRRASCGA